MGNVDTTAANAARRKAADITACGKIRDRLERMDHDTLVGLYIDMSWELITRMRGEHIDKAELTRRLKGIANLITDKEL